MAKPRHLTEEGRTCLAAEKEKLRLRERLEVDKLERRLAKKEKRPFRVHGKGLASWYRNLMLKKQASQKAAEAQAKQKKSKGGKKGKK